VAYIGRLDDQKGVHLVHHAMYYALNRGAQFVLLGSATDRAINDWFWHEKRHLTDNPDIHLELSFNEELAHLIYAGADMMVVPSKFEPCGLTQLISLRYGTIPIVRGVGGLVSTVFDWDYDTFHPQEERTGFVFYESDTYALESGHESGAGSCITMSLRSSNNWRSRGCSMTTPGKSRGRSTSRCTTTFAISSRELAIAGILRNLSIPPVPLNCQRSARRQQGRGGFRG
jgi:hypothetical protein